MDLYLIRHAEALDLGERGITDDAERPLSQNGEGQAVQLARTLQKLGIQLDVVVSSPYLRARQTAEYVRKVFTPQREIVFTDALTPEQKPRRLARFLKDVSDQRIALVGHLPHMPRFVGWLIGGKKTQLNLAKAGAIYLTCDQNPGRGGGVLHWLVNPTWYLQKDEG